MARSNMTTRFYIDKVNKFLKKYRLEHEDAKNKNVARYITVDVVNRKGVPDIDDCILLITLGNMNCDEQEAADILQRWLDDESNKARGIAGAFCELCKDFCLDVPVDSLHKAQCNQLEDFITKRLEGQNKLNELLSKLTEFKDNLENISKDNENKSDEQVEKTEEAPIPVNEETDFKEV